jgi:hypothetical protein
MPQYIMASNKTITLDPEQVTKLYDVHKIENWFSIGLKFLESWSKPYYECEIVDKKKYMLAKIKYGF